MADTIARRTGSKQIRMKQGSSVPAAAADEVQLYVKDVSGTAQFFARTEDGTEHQMTPAGAGIFTIQLAQTASHDDNTPLIVSIFEFDPSVYGTSPTITFRAVAANGNLTVTTHVTLYNATDSEVISNLVFSGSTDQALQSNVVTVGAGAGQMDNSSKIYEVRIFVDSPSLVDDTIELGSVELRIEA